MQSAEIAKPDTSELPLPEVAPESPRPSGVDPTSPLFREAALAAYFSEEDSAPALRPAPPRTLTLFLLAASVVVAAFVGAFVGHAEITTKGRGVLTTEGGVQPVPVQGAGAVAELRVKSGERVRAGEVLLVLDSAGVKADLLQADRQLVLAAARQKSFDSKRRGIYQARRELLFEREELLRARAAVQEDTITRDIARLGRAAALLDAGLATPNDRDTSAEELALATQASLSLKEDLAQVKGQLASLEADLDAEAWALRSEVSAAQTKRDALAFAMSQTTVLAPQAGRLEAVLVRRGDNVSPGTIVGRLIPDGAPVRVVSFVPERDRTFLEIGARARIELDQLPVSEFGAIDGKITRIGSDVASSSELREALGDHAAASDPLVRVEVAVEDNARTRELATYLRAGSLLDVRYTLRRRRVITLVVEPLRRWLHDQ